MTRSKREQSKITPDDIIKMRDSNYIDDPADHVGLAADIVGKAKSPEAKELAKRLYWLEKRIKSSYSARQRKELEEM